MTKTSGYDGLLAKVYTGFSLLSLAYPTQIVVFTVFENHTKKSQLNSGSKLSLLDNCKCKQTGDIGNFKCKQTADIDIIKTIR